MAPSRGKGKTRASSTAARSALRPTRSSKDTSVPDVYQDLLAEVSATESTDALPDRPLTKRKITTPAMIAELQAYGVHEASGSAAVHEESPVGSDGDESDIDFEDVDLDQANVCTSAADGSEDEDEIQDISISVDTTTTQQNRRTAANRTKPISAAEKSFRVLVHKLHIICLLGHCMYVNARCNDLRVQKSLRSKLEKRTISYLNPRTDDSQFQRNRSFMDGLQQASDAFRGAFAVSASGMRRAKWPAAGDDRSNGDAMGREHEGLADFAEFRKAAKEMQGSQDVGNQLFCAMLRAVGVEARVVYSLQVLPFGNVPSKGGTPQRDSKPTVYANAMPIGVSDGMASDSNTSDTAIQTSNNIGKVPSVRRRLGQPTFHTEPPTLSKPTKPRPRPIRKLQYPVFWTEAFNAAQQKWIPVDPIVTQTVGKATKLEPPASYEHNQMTYVFAFEEDVVVRDVTRRYARAYNAKTRRMRVESAEGEPGAVWLKKALRSFRRRGRRLDRDQLEDAELAQREAREGMPANVQDFKEHPVYALERHLKRHEVLWPRREVGKVNAGTAANPRMEVVFRRSDVKIVRNAEKWYRFGRVIKEGEQGLKSVPSRKQPGARSTPRKGVEADDNVDLFGENLNQEGEMEDLYAESQTEPYIPPPVLCGRVPKNAFGNLDIYVPSMVPSGGVHVRHLLTAHAARLLGVSFSDAVTGFNFAGRQGGRRRGTAVIQGAVVAEENAEAVRAVILALEEGKVEEESKARSLLALKGWRRFLTALRIKERVKEYANPNGPVNGDGETEMDEATDVRGWPVVDDGDRDMPTAGLYTLEELMMPAAKPSARSKRKQKVDDDESDEVVSSAYEEESDGEDDGNEGGFERTTRSRRAARKIIDEDSEDGYMPDRRIGEEYGNDEGGGGFIPEDGAGAVGYGDGFAAQDDGLGGVGGTDFGGGFLPDDDMDGDDVGGGFISDNGDVMDVNGTGDSDGENMNNGTESPSDTTIENGAPSPTPRESGGGLPVDAEPSYERVSTSSRSAAEHTPRHVQLATNGDNVHAEENVMDLPSQRVSDTMANRSPTAIEQDGQIPDAANEVAVEDAPSDHGSMLSHDPEDEDAEPDWLESD